MSTNNSSEESKDMPEIILSNTPTSSTDLVTVAYAKSGAVFIQLISAIPDALIENHRTIMNAEAAKKFIDLLCDATDYYPKKVKKPKKKTAKKRKPISSKK